MSAAKEQAREYLVIFTDFPPCPEAATKRERRVQKLFEFFLKPGFRHCFAVCQERPGRLLIIDPHWRGANLLSLDFTEPAPGNPGITVGQWFRNLRQGWLAADWRFAWCKVRQNRADLPPLAPLSCVSVIQHLLGVPGFALTPWQFYQLILRNQPED